MKKAHSKRYRLTMTCCAQTTAIAHLHASTPIPARIINRLKKLSSDNKSCKTARRNCVAIIV